MLQLFVRPRVMPKSGRQAHATARSVKLREAARSLISSCHRDCSQSCSRIGAGDEDFGALPDPVANELQAGAFSFSSAARIGPCSWRISMTAKMSSLLT